MKPKTYRVFRFLLVGGACTALSYAILVAGSLAGLHYLVSATAGWIAPLLVSFAWHQKFTFGDRSGDRLDKLLRYLAGAVTQWAVVCLGYIVALDVLGLGLTTAFLLNAGLAASFSYTFMRLAVFRVNRHKGQPTSPLHSS